MSASKPLSWRMSWMRLQCQLMQRRKALGLTQEDACAKLRVSRSQLQRWELGKSVPDAFELFRWADLLGISITSEVVFGVKSDAFADIANVPLGSLQSQPDCDEARSVEA